MEIKEPLCITSRLLPGVKIGGAEVSIEYTGDTHVAPWNDGRQGYRWLIDFDDGREFSESDLASGVGGGSLQEGLESLLVFLGAFAAAIAYQERTGLTSENADLFSAGLADWATENSDEISMLACELEENPREFIIET